MNTINHLHKLLLTAICVSITCLSYCNINNTENTNSQYSKKEVSSAFSRKSKKICLADDSGLEIDILNKQPGIYSARWAGNKNDFNLAISKIYSKLDSIDKLWKTKKIHARFICALTIFGMKKKPLQSIGIIEGKISKKKIGSNGFGYDPIFIPRGKKLTFGQMKPSDKHKIDHRAIAFRKIKKFL